jgi:hypothetical protein
VLNPVATSDGAPGGSDEDIFTVVVGGLSRLVMSICRSRSLRKVETEAARCGDEKSKQNEQIGVMMMSPAKRMTSI